MLYKKQSKISGAWAKASELGKCLYAKIVSETTPQPSTFTDKNGKTKMQDVCKVEFEGMDGELNVNLNRATINGLVDAFGEDSKAWQGHRLSVETEKMRVAGKAVTALYLIPEGFKRIDNEDGYAMIVKEGGAFESDNIDELEIPNIDIEE